MIHAELFAGKANPSALIVSHCPIDLVLVWTRPDGDHSIELWRCPACGLDISYDATAQVVRNSYPSPPHAQITRELAESMTVQGQGQSRGA